MDSWAREKRDKVGKVVAEGVTAARASPCLGFNNPYIMREESHVGLLL